MELSKEFINRWKVKNLERYFPDDKKYKVKCNFVDGVPDGKYELYYKGKLECCGEFIKGISIGVWKNYFYNNINRKFYSIIKFTIKGNNYIQEFAVFDMNDSKKYKYLHVNESMYGEFYYNNKDQQLCLQKIEI